jgi:serine/threonine protein kinase
VICVRLAIEKLHLTNCFISSLLTPLMAGFRYLVMERMQSPLGDVVPLLLQNSAKSVAFGPIAAGLLSCVQAIHEHKHVVVDVKPENFMLATPVVSKKAAVTKKKQASKQQQHAEELASRIRILDLALVQPWTSVGAHRVNQGSGMAGTPLYASMNIHKGETPSRRDDLESLGYLIAELLMQIASGRDDTTKTLPWSKGKSDDEIGELKEHYVDDPNSVFYSRMGGQAVVRVFKNFMEEVKKYSFKKTPDYDSLRKILLELEVPLTAATPKPTTKKAAPKRSTAAKAASVAVAAVAVAAVAGSSKRRVTRSQKTPSKVARAASAIANNDDDDDDDDEYTDNEVFQDAQDETIFFDSMEQDEMDWDVISDENQEPGGELRVGFSLVVESGPHKGLSIDLVHESLETVVIGRNPRTKPGEKALKLPDDGDVDDSHIRLDLSVGKKLLSVNVTDLNSRGSFVGSEKIRKGKDYMIFCNQTIRVGKTFMKIKPLQPKVESISQSSAQKKTVMNEMEMSRTGGRRAAAAATKSSPSEADMNVEHKLKRQGVRLDVIDGPYKGKSYILESGGVEAFTAGSNPSAKKGDPLILGADKEIGASHVRLELIASKKLLSVNVTDLKSGGGTFVNRNVVGEGKNMMAFMNDKIKIGNTTMSIKVL